MLKGPDMSYILVLIVAVFSAGHDGGADVQMQPLTMYRDLERCSKAKTAFEETSKVSTHHHAFNRWIILKAKCVPGKRRDLQQ